MRYRHLAKHQYILQDALRSAKGQPFLNEDGEPVNETDPKFLERLRITKDMFDAKRLSTFRSSTGKGFEFPDDPASYGERTPEDVKSPLRNRTAAILIWEDLNKRGHIKSALKHFPNVLTRKSAFTRRDVATTLAGYYDVHDGSIEKFRKRGLGAPGSDEWYCYKMSNLQPGHVVKSLMKIEADIDFFAIDEEQRASRIHEGKGVVQIENSTGFGFVKSRRLWCFMREQESEQPRIFCFHDNKDPRNDRTSKPTPLHQTEEKFTILLGHMFEGVLTPEKSGFQKSPVALTLPSYERQLWCDETRSTKLDHDAQIDIHDLANTAGTVHGDFFIPQTVRDHLLSGTV